MSSQSASVAISQTIQARKVQALAVAKHCTQILSLEFGATDVILFGSLRGDSPWHWQSDLDLAVQGLSPETISKAFLRLETEVPHWLSVDLVDLDAVPAYFRARILQENPMPEHPHLALKIRIEDEMVAMAQTLERIELLLSQVEAIPEIALIPALASYISDFYNGCERISERIAVSLDDHLPQGSNWHQQLLAQLAEPGGHGRPALWQGALLLQLNDYRAFRHLDRHRYKIELQLEPVLKLAEAIPATYTKIQTAIAEFNTWLTPSP